MKSWAWECLCLAVFLVLTGWQAFIPPITGLSDNNDFSKVFGPAHICKAGPDNVNAYLVTTYAAGPKCAWASGFRSSEILLVKLARYLSRPFTGRYRFDLRASAALHLLVLTVALALLLNITRHCPPGVRFVLPGLAIAMFTDVAYVAYLNSAYMDNASWVLFLLLASIAARACISTAGRESGIWLAAAYTIAGTLVVFSKAQHAVLGVPFAGLALLLAWRQRQTDQRAAWCVGGLMLLAGTAIMPALTPPEYRSISLYNLIFYRLAADDRNFLPELGLDDSYEKWIGTNAFSPGSPLPDPDWTRAFTSRASFTKVAQLYLQHPSIAIRELDRELHDSVHAMRPDYMANYRREDGFAPHTIATRFSLWSNTKIWLLTRYPHLLIWLYGLPVVAAIWHVARPRAQRPLIMPLALALVVAGISEFVICSLADAVDTHRHLFLFHAITETVILLTASWFLAAPSSIARELP